MPDQQSLLPAAGGLGALCVMQWVQDRALLGVQEAKTPQALEILQVRFAKKYTLVVHLLNYNFMNFVD